MTYEQLMNRRIGNVARIVEKFENNKSSWGYQYWSQVLEYLIRNLPKTIHWGKKWTNLDLQIQRLKC